MIVATFQDKMGRDWLRKREKKIIVPISSYRPRNREFQKNSKKIQKIKKTSLWLLFKPKRDGTS